MNTFRMEIVTPDRSFPARTVTLLNVPAAHGRLTVLPGHEPFIGELHEGDVYFDAVNETSSASPVIERETWAIRRGTLLVRGDQTTVLVRGASPPPKR